MRPRPGQLAVVEKEQQMRRRSPAQRDYQLGHCPIIRSQDLLHHEIDQMQHRQQHVQSQLELQ